MPTGFAGNAPAKRVKSGSAGPMVAGSRAKTDQTAYRKRLRMSPLKWRVVKLVNEPIWRINLKKLGKPHVVMFSLLDGGPDVYPASVKQRADQQLVTIGILTLPHPFSTY